MQERVWKGSSVYVHGILQWVIVIYTLHQESEFIAFSKLAELEPYYLQSKSSLGLSL